MINKKKATHFIEQKIQLIDFICTMKNQICNKLYINKQKNKVINNIIIILKSDKMRI